MSSFVYYKFKSQKDESRVSFDGTGISIFDLKREIILAKGFEKAIDFDIVLLDPNTDEGLPSSRGSAAPSDHYKEYDDSYILPRSSTVVVKRTPVRAGKSKIPRYLSGSAPASRPVHATRSAPAPLAYSGNMSKRFDGREPEKPKEETKPVRDAI
jgi:protein MPE1